MQTTEMTDIKTYAIQARARQERLVPKGYTLTMQDVQWIKGLAMCMGCSDSQILRGILARAREMEIEFADKQEEKKQNEN